MRFSQLHHPLLDLCRRLVSMPPRRPALLHQSLYPLLPIPANPHIPGLPCDLVTLAQLRHRPISLFIFKDKPQFLFHHTARFPWHALFFNSHLPSFAVSGIPPVYSVRHPPGLYPPSPDPNPLLGTDQEAL